MNRFKFFSTAAFVLFLVLRLVSCGNKSQKAEHIDAAEIQSSAVIEVDSLLSNAEALTDQTVNVEAVCTHICQHGGGKIFLMGSDDTRTIRCEAGKEIGKFDQNCVNSIVQVTGVLKEQRIDEAYLQQWEARLKNNTDQKHGASAAGCSSERKARQEAPANSPEERIANFRKRIVQRNEKEGKNYLSFYYIDATGYKIINE